MAAALDITALRSLTAIVDCGGFHRAAEALHISQSAVSQHVRRLEKTIGRPVVARAGRTTHLTAAGELLVAEARVLLCAHDEALHRLGIAGARDERTLTVGASEHAADRLLPAVTRALAQEFPAVGLRFRIDRGARLHEAVNLGRIDIAIFLGEPGVDGQPVGTLPLAWFAAPGWTLPPHGTPLPVIAIDDPCTIRRQALRTLARHHRTATVTVNAAYLAGVLSAARAGAGVALLADLGPAPDGLRPVSGLPTVDPQPMHVRARAKAPAGLAKAVVTAVGETLGADRAAGADARPPQNQTIDTTPGRGAPSRPFRTIPVD
ncbi:MAG TPA: LysR substrate-binding domain-containing protein [Actinocrinis sp.]|nr:LysR substrate-binding domain-containing protein [Actinocrinis sp.]